MIFLCLKVLPQIECGELIQQLIESYRIAEIQVLLDRLSHGWPNRPLWTLYKKVCSFRQSTILKAFISFETLIFSGKFLFRFKAL